MQRQLEDSENQQRAFIKLEKIQAKRLTGPSGNPPTYNVEIAIVFQNRGQTAATDVHTTGQIIGHLVEMMQKQSGDTNGPKRWNPNDIRKPEIKEGGDVVMPGEIFTNTFYHQINAGYGFYLDYWVSYRDIYRRAWTLGAQGDYDFTNDTFTISHTDWGTHITTPQTNSQH